MTTRLRMLRMLEGDRTWVPVLDCDWCDGRVLAAGRVLWDRDSADLSRSGNAEMAVFLAACSDSCEESLKRTDKAVNWGTMPVATFLILLSASTSTVDEVVQTVEAAAFGKHSRMLRQSDDEDAEKQ